MGRMSDDWYRQRAVELFQKPRKAMDRSAVEVTDHAAAEPGTGPPRPGVFRDETPRVSSGTNPGAWVMMWAWIPDPPEESSGDEKDEGAGGAAAPDRDNRADA